MIPLPPLPPWDAPREVMTRWVHAMLDAIGDECVLRVQKLGQRKTPDGDTAISKYWENWDLEIDLAEHGDIEPLQKRLVSLGRTDAERTALAKIVVRFVRLEDLPRGVKWKDLGPEENDPVVMAVEYTRCIQELWAKYYPEHQRRSSRLVSAVDIAAEWCGADPEEVARKLERTPKEPPEGSAIHGSRMLFREVLSEL